MDPPFLRRRLCARLAASRRKSAGRLALASGAEVLVANYRLAPEHVFPVAIGDALAAWSFPRGQDHLASRIVIAGGSGGGGLAIACALAARDRGLGVAAGVTAMSPWGDLTCSGASMAENASRDVECSRDGLLSMAGMYLRGHDPTDPLALPVFGRFEGAPPLLCVVGSEEVLLDEPLRMVRAAGHARCDATLHVAPGMQHVFPVWTGVFPEAGCKIAQIDAWSADRTSKDAVPG